MTATPHPARGQGRAALIAAAADVVASEGAHALSARAVARTAGVTHASVAHHFGGREGLLVALATEGFALLSDRLEAAGGPPGSRASGVAYARFAVECPGHFEVMFDGALVATRDPDLMREAGRAWARLAGERGGQPGAITPDAEVMARWALVHGVASLWRSGLLPPAMYEAGIGALAQSVVDVLGDPSISGAADA